MKSMEIDSSAWSDEQIQQAFAKLEELGYKPDKEHGSSYLNGKTSISANYNGEYLGFDRFLVSSWKDDLTPTFEELMNYTKEDVQ